jgi:biotin synthase-related radical SAM superfamily protein
MEILHTGDGDAVLLMNGEEFGGKLELVGYHCPRQAYITVSGGCIFQCRYCPVPGAGGRRKTVDEIVGMVDAVQDRIDAIAITSGVMTDIQEEETYILKVVKALLHFGIPIGVSIYPTRQTHLRLYAAGVAEVKFNLETATPELFGRLCPGLDRHLIFEVLLESVALFGPGRVFSNVIIGLSETDEEIESCARSLTTHGIIPVLRPLNPAAGLISYPRPSRDRLIRIAAMHYHVMRDAGLNPGRAVSMCTACTGCDIVPGRDYS